jgi:hypothetical protein
MIAFLSLLKKIPFSVYVIAALLIVIGVMYIDIQRLHVAALTAEKSAQSAIDANNTNMLTIKQLQAANTSWQQKCQEDSLKSQDAIAGLKAAFNQAAKDNADYKAKLDRIYEQDATAKDWGNAAVPVDVANGLRAAVTGR